jgi:hypothetical protein
MGRLASGLCGGMSEMREYDIFDMSDTTGGGVLLAIKNEYNSEHVPELDTDCEIVWAKMNLKGNGTIYICSYYL